MGKLRVGGGSKSGSKKRPAKVRVLGSLENVSFITRLLMCRVSFAGFRIFGRRRGRRE